jgi:3-hydroxyisobutyrate dehydrogenase-like beta-hydroxyacid dehydrogenase
MVATRNSRRKLNMRVGFIGLGNMGGPMCLNLIRAGYKVTVFDLSRDAAAPLLEAGAAWANDPGNLASRCELVLSSLPGPKEVQEVVAGAGGIAAAIAPGSIYVDLSTNSVAVVRRLHQLLKDKQVEMLDAPVSGGTVGAQRGKLAVWVGGDQAAFHRIEPMLKAVGDKLLHLGEIGSGTIAKLVHNQIALSLMMVVAEGFTLGVKAGADPEMLLKAVSEGMLGRSNPLSIVSAVAFKGAVDNVQFALKLARKDLALAAELARDHNVSMPLAAQFREELEAAMARGWGARDVTSMFAFQEEIAGVKVRPLKPPPHAS